jgi:hypothetical protein
LQVTLRSPAVKPGALQRVAISYVEGALVQARVAFPNKQPVTVYHLTDAHGRLTIDVRAPSDVKLSGGHATGVIAVNAVSGPWRQLKRISIPVQPGATERIALTYGPSTYMRAVAAFPGGSSQSLFSVTDKYKHTTFVVTVPRNIRLSRGRATAQVTLSVLTNNHHAQATRSILVSDMVLSADGSAIKSCVQLQTLHVSYLAHVPLKIVLTLPHNGRVPLSALTDSQGNAMLRVQMRYARAHSPVRIGVVAIDTRQGVHRSEQIGISVPIPAGCRS